MLKPDFGNIGRDRHSLIWESAGRTVVAELEGSVENSALSPTFGLVLIIVREQEADCSELLYGFSVEGQKVFKTHAPKDYSFYYFSQHIDHETALVCISKNNTLDWYFSIDPKTGELEPLNRAY